MAQIQPGKYVLYKEPGIDQPPWPAVIYADEYAPLDIQQRRPSGYVTLVLLIGEPYRFRWATTNQLSPLDSVGDVVSATYTNELKQAYDTVTFMKDAGLGLEYWRDEVGREFGIEMLSNSTSEPEEAWDAEFEADEEFKQAPHISYQAHHGSTPLDVSTMSRSSHKRGRRQSSIITIDDFESCPLPLPGARLLSSPKRPRSSRPRYGLQDFSVVISDDDELSEQHPRTKSLSIEHKNPDSLSQQKSSRPQFLGGTALDQIYGLSSLGQRASAPVSDTIEGDISESKDFVQVHVGPDLEIRTLQKKDVWNRPYFQDTRTGTNHFRLNEKDIWELCHPQLVNINPEDFQFIAEYLTDGDFGLRYPESKEQMKESIAQCVSAWETSEKLGMGDMLEHIAEKVRYLDWDNEDVLTIAIFIYRSSGLSLHAHDLMKEWIADFLAHHFWTYIKDENISHYFRKRLRLLPELERDVFVKRAESLTKGTEFDEDHESDEDAQELQDDADL